MHDRRQNIFVRSVVTDLPQNKSITVRKELLQFSRQRLSGNIAALLKEVFVARDDDALKSNGLFCFLETRAEILHRLFPLRNQTAVRFFEIIVERRALPVDVLVAMLFCGALCLRSDLSEASF